MKLLRDNGRRWVTGLLLTLVITGCGSSPESFEDLKAAGMKAFLNGQYPAARAYLRKALTEQPSNKEILYFTGLAYRHDYLMDSAFFYVKRANLLYPEDRELTEQLYEIANIMGEWQAAKEALLAMVAMGDPLEKHIQDIVDTHAKTGSITNTYYFLNKWFNEFGLNDPARFRQLASLATKVDSFAKAHVILDSAITRWGSNDDCLAVRSEIFFKERKLDSAIAILRDLIERHPENGDFKMNMAHGLANKKTTASVSEALEIYRALQATLPDPSGMDSLITVVEQMRQDMLDSK